MDKSSKNRRMGAIGIIGRTVGSTMMTVVDPEEQNRFLDTAAAKIKPQNISFAELEEYLIERYQAVPHAMLPREMDVLKSNVIMNHFPEVLDMPPPLGENPTLEELQAYAEQNTAFFQAMEYPAEKLGLEMKAYSLPNVATSVPGKPVIVQLEMKTEYLCMQNGGEELSDDLTLFRGVCEKDIRERTPRFMNYVYTLKRLGKL